jgi:hypothetical protein
MLCLLCAVAPELLLLDAFMGLMRSRCKKRWRPQLSATTVQGDALLGAVAVAAAAAFTMVGLSQLAVRRKYLWLSTAGSNSLDSPWQQWKPRESN